jgi:hypothetical protein
MMRTVLTFTAGLAGLMLLSSCASLAPPARPDYTGADSVDAANTSQIVGAWTVRSLNPYPNEEPQSTTIEYRQDGTVLGTIEPQGDSAAVLGNMRFELTGNWSLEADQIRHSDIEMSSSSDNAMGSMVSKMINGKKGIAGEGNIYELSANRMVIMGSDGTAMEYVRQ